MLAGCMSAKEVWKVVSEASDYAVSDLGRVKRIRPNAFGKGMGGLLQPLDNRGYKRVCLRVDGRKIYRGIHVLVCRAFNGAKPEPELQCAHRDGDKGNNTPGNLYWATAKQNSADRDRHGGTMRGDRHWTRRLPEKVRRGYRPAGDWAKGERMAAAKLTEAQVIEIYSTPKTHGSGKALASKFGISMGLVGHIRNGRAWTYLTRPEGKSDALRSVSEQAP